jgi:hypothetical protein
VLITIQLADSHHDKVLVIKAQQIS